MIIGVNGDLQGCLVNEGHLHAWGTCMHGRCSFAIPFLISSPHHPLLLLFDCQTAAGGLLRLCQRLLPYKPEVAELLLQGLQLVPSLDPEVRGFD